MMKLLTAAMTVGAMPPANWYRDPDWPRYLGWRDGYAQAINDVEHLLDHQTNKESNK